MTAMSVGERRRVSARRDSLLGDRPVLLSSKDEHSVWANSAMLRLAGIDDSLPRTVLVGLNLLLLACPDSTQPVQTASVDGFIVYCSAEQSDLLGSVLARALPTVLVEQRPQRGTSQVGIDDLAGATQAARHLAELGHTHIGILSLEITREYRPEPVTPEREAGTRYLTTARRFQGYRRGAPQATFYPLETAQNTPQEGENRTLELLAQSPQVSAILCMSDVLAQGALNAARGLGRRVPQDLSIIGFDDLPSSETLNLTSVWQPTAEKGRQAGQALLAMETRPDAVFAHRRRPRGAAFVDP